MRRLDRIYLRSILLAAIVSAIAASVAAQVETASASNVIGGNPVWYKFLYAAEYNGKRGYTDKERAERELARKSGWDNFLTQINAAGNEGYKVISTIYGDFAIAKLEEASYEYNVFDATSSIFFVKAGIRDRLSELSENGFKIYDHSLLSAGCTPDIFAGQNIGETCEYADFYLFGKEKGSRKRTEQIIVNSSPGWGNKPSTIMAAEIDEKLAEGFYPVKILSKFEILLEKAKDKNDILDEKPDVKIIRSGWGTNDLKKKVNELAKQGYRLSLVGNGIAVMHRNSDTNGKIFSYIWLKADKKGFEKELAKLQQMGASYSHVYPDGQGTKDSLIFELRLDGKSANTEFKILKFGFNEREDLKEGKVYIDLTPEAKDSIKKMNQLAKEGFVVRDLFESDKVSAILERIE